MADFQAVSAISIPLSQSKKLLTNCPMLTRIKIPQRERTGMEHLISDLPSLHIGVERSREGNFTDFPIQIQNGVVARCVRSQSSLCDGVVDVLRKCMFHSPD